MNVFKLNQRIFSGIASSYSSPPALTDEVVKFSLACAPLRRGIFRIPKKQSNSIIFLVSFLSYLIGVFPSIVFALPAGGKVQAGSATIMQPSAKQITIHQTTEKAIIDWQAFGVGSTEKVNFKLPQGGVTLNRVTGNDVSQIFGQLTSNGNLWLINPNGILFGNSAQVDVHGLLATTSNISNTDFLSNNYNFSIPSSLNSTVINQGSITVAEAGLVALVAPGVQNMGIINARLGKVSLASGKTFTVDLYGDQLINLAVDSKVTGQVTGMDGEILPDLVTNKGSIFADGGVVRLDVNAAQNIVDRVINMDGIIQAQSVSEKNGTITLMGGDAGAVSVTGTLNASGYDEGETGGNIHVLGDMLDFSANGFIDVSGDLGGGTLLFGGDYQGKGLVPNAMDVYVGPNTQTFADAVTSGNGGKIIFWADRRMRFNGIVKGRGGKYFGDGGLVEVSGKEELYFDGSVDTTATNGKTGTLLLDPKTITVANGSGSTTASGATSFTTIYENTLESMSASTNVTLQATDSIVLGSLDLQQVSGNSVTFKVTDGTISVTNPSDTISTNGGSINFSATGNLTLGTLNSNGGDISLTGNDLLLFGTLSSGAGNISITHVDSGKIGLGDTSCGGACAMTIDNTELGKMSGNQLIIGGASNGDIYVNDVTQSSSTFSNGVALNVNAHVSGSKGSVIFEGTASSFSALTAGAMNGIELNSNLTTTTGALALDGDSDSTLDTEDYITFASGITLSSAADISLSAANGGMNAAGAITLTTPSSITLTGNMTAAGAVALTANSGISLNNSISTSSGVLNINANSSTLSLASGITLSSAGALTLAAGSTSSSGGLNLTSTASTINVNNALVSAGAINMSAASGLTLSNNTLTAAGNISLEADSTNSGSGQLNLVSGTTITSSAGSIALGATTGGISSTGPLTLNASNGITVADSLTIAGVVNIDADTDNNGSGDFTVSTGSLSTTNNALTVTANDLVLSGTLDSGTGSTTINISDGGSLGLGFSSGFGMNITTTEQGKLVGTGDLSLVNGNITFLAGNSLSHSGKLNIGQSGGTITGQGALTLSAAKGLAINSSNLSTAGNLSLEGDSNNSTDSDDSISFVSGASLTASAGSITLNATTGGISGAGALNLNATGGININDSLTSEGTMTFDADTDNDGSGTFTIAASKALTTGSNALSITAGDLDFNGTLNSGTAGTTIFNSLSGATIGLGTTSNMTLSSTELGNITAGSLTIGGGTNGNIVVSGVASNNSDQFGILNLNATASNSSVTFGTADSTFQGLVVNSENGITLSSSLTTNGTTNLISDSDGDGAGNFSISSGKTLTTNNNALTITSNSMSFNSTGRITSGTATTTLKVSDSGTIGLGNTAGNFSLTNSDLALITSGSLIIGGATNGTITVDGVTSTSKPLTLIATASGKAVNFASTASSFNDLTLDAGTGGVDFGVNVSANGNLSVTSGGNITDIGTLTISGASSFTTDVANQVITLDNTSNSFTGVLTLNTSGNSGNATLVSDNAVTLSTSNVGGNIAVTVGGNNSLNVIGAGSAGGSISLLADDDIIFTAAGDLTTTTGKITINADNDLDKNSSGGALTMANGTVFNAGSGALALSADEDITLGLIQTDSASDTALTLTSTSGGVVDGDIALPPNSTRIGGDTSAWLDINAANGRLVADLVTGFGKDNAIETKVKSLDIDNSTAGKVNIFEFDNLDILKINNAGESAQVSFEGLITGTTNCVADGTCFFISRDMTEKLISGTGKTLSQLADGTTQQLKFNNFAFDGQNLYEKTPADHVSSSSNGPFTADLFSEKFELVELAAGTEAKFDSMEVSKSFWGGPKQTTLEVAESKASDKKVRSRQRTAKRKKRAAQKLDDTASITNRKIPKPRIQSSESGYLGVTSPARRGVGEL